MDDLGRFLDKAVLLAPDAAVNLWFSSKADANRFRSRIYSHRARKRLLPRTSEELKDPDFTGNSPWEGLFIQIIPPKRSGAVEWRLRITNQPSHGIVKIEWPEDRPKPKPKRKRKDSK